LKEICRGGGNNFFSRRKAMEEVVSATQQVSKTFQYNGTKFTCQHKAAML